MAVRAKATMPEAAKEQAREPAAAALVVEMTEEVLVRLPFAAGIHLAPVVSLRKIRGLMHLPRQENLRRIESCRRSQANIARKRGSWSRAISS